MFDMEIRADGLHISGYVNAVGRDSRPVVVPERGLVVEQIAPGAFAESLRSYKDVKIKLDHMKMLGGIMDGNLTLSEDTIGLRAETVITDPEVIEAAERGELRGWSFGFVNPKCRYEERADGLLPRRIVEGLTLREVSIIDSRQRPCYVGTSIEYRSDNDEDYDVVEYRESSEEFRFNPYHDPSNGRFTSVGGSGGYVMVADHAGRTEIGRKFNGGYVDTDTDKIFENNPYKKQRVKKTDDEKEQENIAKATKRMKKEGYKGEAYLQETDNGTYISNGFIAIKTNAKVNSNGYKEADTLASLHENSVKDIKSFKYNTKAYSLDDATLTEIKVGSSSKTKKVYDFGENTPLLNADFVKTALTGISLKSGDKSLIVEVPDSSVKPVRFINSKTGAEALVLPIRRISSRSEEIRMENMVQTGLDGKLYEISNVKYEEDICEYCGTVLANIPVINRTAKVLDDMDMPCPECGRLMTVHDLCAAAFRRSEELRFNPYHDPSNGRFTSGGGGGGDYIFIVPKGQAHKGILVKNENIDDKETASQYYHAVYENSNVNDEKHRLINGTNQYATNTYNESIEGQKFGVQGGAGTAYTLVTVDGENKLIRNDYLSISSDGRVLISDKSLSQPHEFKDTGIDYANAPHSYSPASIAGVSKGNAMSFDDADNGKANPNYSKGTYGYTHNCQTCVVVHEARMRGYDVEARAKTTAVARDLSYDTTLAWIDPATGRKPSMTHISSGQDYGKTLDTSIKAGERYSVQFSRSRSGHIITASRDENNNIRLYDPQTNKKVTGTKDINSYFSNQRALSVEFYRVDNLDINESVVNVVTKKAK